MVSANIAERGKGEKSLSVMISLALVVFLFTEAVIPAEKKVVDTHPKLDSCQWVFGNGTISSMPKKWRVIYGRPSSATEPTSS